MNKYQRIVVIVFSVNIALMLLFPPFVDNPLHRGVIPSFEGFHPLISVLSNHHVHSQLLTLEIMYAAINGLIAWLVLDRQPQNGELPAINTTRGLAIFAVVNLIFLMLFPPFESFSAMLKTQTPTFDGFYLVFGDKQNRQFFAPLLYMEVILVTINLLVIWLLFNTVRRSDPTALGTIPELTEALSPDGSPYTKMYEPDEAGHQPSADGDAHLGAGPDRRRHWDPRFRGSDRRNGGDRRQKTRTN